MTGAGYSIRLDDIEMLSDEQRKSLGGFHALSKIIASRWKDRSSNLRGRHFPNRRRRKQNR